MELKNLTNQYYSVEYRVEEVSRRIWVTGYSTEEPDALRSFLTDLALRRGMEKIVLPVRSSDVQNMAGNGFHEEGRIPGYFHDEDSHFLAAFPIHERSVSITLEHEKGMLHDITTTPRLFKVSFPPGITVRRAEKSDSSELAKLFSTVFKSYPTPVYDQRYLDRTIEKGDIFLVACIEKTVVAVAAAEIDWEHKRAELSDCATLPDYRGLGLNTLLLAKLEEECLSRNINCIFSLARASSYGMNLVLHRLGYIYGGTLVNNCHIGGRLENMNVWSRPGKNAL